MLHKDDGISNRLRTSIIHSLMSAMIYAMLIPL